MFARLQLFQKKHYKIIAADLTKQQALAANPKVMQQITFTENLRGANNRAILFITEEAKNYFRFFTRNRERIIILF